MVDLSFSSTERLSDFFSSPGGVRGFTGCGLTKRGEGRKDEQIVRETHKQTELGHANKTPLNLNLNIKKRENRKKIAKKDHDLISNLHPSAIPLD